MLQIDIGECTSKVRPNTKIRIAIADDHPIFRDGLSRLLLLEEDFEVVAQLGDGFLVSEVLRQCDPDILLLDQNMPGLSGLGVLQRLRAASSRTRVILLTASENHEELVEALKLGSSGIVLKQTATDSLADTIRRVHAGEISVDSNAAGPVIRRFIATEEVSSPPSIVGPTVPREHDRSLLSRREKEVVNLVAQGCRNQDMADRMFISEQTVKNHLHNIFDKLEVSDRLELAIYCVANNLHT